MDLDWDKLRVFKAVANCGSISSAASMLGESVANVSRKMTDLESGLHVQLFHRSTKGVEMTDAGQTALRHIETMADSAEALTNDMSQLDASQSGEVKLVVGDGIGAHWLAPRAPKFQQANPSIQLILNVTDQHGRLPDENFDIVIQFSRPDSPELIVQRLGTMHYTFFASQAYVDVYGHPETVFDLHKHRCIFHSGYTNQTDRWSERGQALEKLVPTSIISNSTSVIVQSCVSGGGVAMLPSYFAEVDSRLLHIPLEEVTPIHFWAVYSKRIRNLSRGKVVGTGCQKLLTIADTIGSGTCTFRQRKPSSLD